MAPTTPTPSPRLVKAAAAEREQLARHRRELVQTRAGLRGELDRIEASLHEVAEREALLDRLTGFAPDHQAPGEDQEALAGRTADHEDEARSVLRGPAIRGEAVRALLAHPDGPEALHYRDWYALLQDAGFEVAGKDPLATFLTQLSRSPAVRKSTQAGVYELDRQAVPRLRRRRDEVQEGLRELTATQTNGADGAAIRARRTELNTELGRVEKALEEVETLFEVTDEPALAA